MEGDTLELHPRAWPRPPASRLACSPNNFLKKHSPAATCGQRWHHESDMSVRAAANAAAGRLKLVRALLPDIGEQAINNNNGSPTHAFDIYLGELSNGLCANDREVWKYAYKR